MKKMVLAMAFFALNCFAAGNLQNWNGMKDTAQIYVSSTNTVRCSSLVYDLSDGQNIRLFVGVNDTGAAGYGSDSIGIIYGFRTGFEVMDSAGTRDTSWDIDMIVDSINSDSLGLMKNVTVYVDSTGSFTRGALVGRSDTLNVRGFAYQSRNFSPEWDCLIQPFARGNASNRIGNAVRVRFAIVRREHIPTRNK